MIKNKKIFFRGLGISGKYLFLKDMILNKAKAILGRDEKFESSLFFYYRCCSMNVSLSDRGTSYLADYEGHQYLIRKNTSDENVFVDVILRDEYRVIIDIILKNKTHVKTMIDAGANVGFTTMHFARSIKGLQVIALEPDHGNFLAMMENIGLSALPGIIPVEGGVAPEIGWLRPKTGLDDREWGKAFSFSTDGVSGIRGFDIDSLLLEQGWSELDFLKMDIEGGENDIFLRNGHYTDFLLRVNMIAIEIHDKGDKKEMISKILIDYGFFVFDNNDLTIGIKRKFIV